MPGNREIVTDAFHAWMSGTGYVVGIFADDMTWKITGRSVASRKYPSTRQLLDEVLHPLAARFSADDPFRPSVIPGIYDDEKSTTASPSTSCARAPLLRYEDSAGRHFLSVSAAGATSYQLESLSCPLCPECDYLTDRKSQEWF